MCNVQVHVRCCEVLIRLQLVFSIVVIHNQRGVVVIRHVAVDAFVVMVRVVVEGEKKAEEKEEFRQICDVRVEE